ncbi:Hypothetical predicted protein [Mytilus galloprovincialis]|uniref:DNA-directed DNA polymerase n=1 Tax=Mytilus galloprovincialis TaxID=29158 RepID=A0A8B6FT66_MYTGA|nr:Hypothetical predicted protein [Mytilus galloprovincialis]
MSQKLPTGDFKWEKDPNYYKKIPKGRGCLIECDLQYTKKCKKKTYKYPLAPEKMKIKKEELSDYQLNLLGDKPLGQAILDYSKQLMYSFYYDVANELWEKNELVASDTDSMILSVKTKDIYKDMEEIIDELDTSGYPKDHPLYSEKNKKVIGKFKDELNGKIMNEIVFLKSKAYSFTLTDLSEEKKLKGIGKTTINKDIKFDDYKDCLFNNKTKMNKMCTMNSSKHKMFVNEVNKISMSPFDDKRYILDNGIDTQPFGF